MRPEPPMRDPEELDELDEHAVAIIDLEPPAAGSLAFYARSALQRLAALPYPRWPRPVWIGLVVVANMLGLLLILQPYLPLPTFSLPGPVPQVQGPPPASAASSFVDLSVSNDIAYIDADSGLVSAYRAENGALLWRRQLTFALSRILATPTALFRLSSTDGYGQIESLRPADGATLWTQRVPPVGTLSMQTQQGVLFVNTRKGIVYAIRENDGHILWQFGSGMPAPLDAFFAVQNGIALIRNREDTLYAIRVSDGVPVYHFDNSMPASVIGIAGNIIFTEANTGLLSARNTTNGSLLWQFRFGRDILWTPTVANGLVYVNTIDGTFTTLRGRDGALLWRYSSKAVVSPPAISGATLYLLLQDSSVVAFRTKDGSQIWQRQLPSPTLWSGSPPLLDGNILYINLDMSNSTIYALEANNGTMLWSHAILSATTLFPPIAREGVLYLGRDDHSIDSWQGASGRFLWHYASAHPLLWYPTTANGVLFALALNGTVDAINLSSGVVLWRYPAKSK